ncbi:MAG: alpha/beta fold hydrolase, partial [Bacteroidota bacterium]
MELNYKEFGQGDPIIILHGLFGTLDNWQTIARQLANNYMVYIVDQRNHGRSPHSQEFNYQVMADDLASFMESRWIYKAHLIGHSMGGKTAMQFALNHSDLVDRLIIVDIGPQQYEGRHQTIFEALISIDIKKVESRQQAEAMLATRIEDVGVRQFLLKNLSRQKEGGYQWKMNLPVLYKEYDRVFEAV